MSDESTSIILKKLLDKTDEQTATLARIEANQANYQKAFEAHLVDDKDVEARLGKVEEGQKKVKWMALGAGFAFGAVWRVVEAFVGSHH